MIRLQHFYPQAGLADLYLATVFFNDSLQLRPDPPDGASHLRYRLRLSLLRLSQNILRLPLNAYKALLQLSTARCNSLPQTPNQCHLKGPRRDIDDVVIMHVSATFPCQVRNDPIGHINLHLHIHHLIPPFPMPSRGLGLAFRHRRRELL
jgi:hypothetical protein